MKLFTFSGISGSFSGTNDGAGMIELARNFIAALPSQEAVDYNGVDDANHFRSYVNYTTMLGNLGDAVRLGGVTVLNEEVKRLSPNYAAAISSAMAGNSAEMDQYAKDEMNLGKLSEALLGFLIGKLPAKFKSK